MSKIIAIHSPRRSNGATTVALNLAAVLVSWRNRVCLMDLNFAYPDISSLVDTDDAIKTPAINDHLSGRCNIADTLLQVSGDAFPNRGGELYVAPFSRSFRDSIRLLQNGYDLDLLNNAIRDIAKMGFDFVILDTRDSLRDEAFLPISISDTHVAVAKPSKLNHSTLIFLLDLVKNRMDTRQSLLVFNEMPPSIDFNKFSRDVEEVYETKVGAFLPVVEGMSISRSLERKFFILEHPGHKYSLELTKCAALL